MTVFRVIVLGLFAIVAVRATADGSTGFAVFLWIALAVCAIAWFFDRDQEAR